MGRKCLITRTNIKWSQISLSRIW